MGEQIIWQLRIGTRLTGFTVEPDGKWPGMWRIHTPSGKISDMVNLSRARDSALILARQHSRATGHGSGDQPICWEKAGGLAPEAGSMRLNGGEAPG